MRPIKLSGNARQLALAYWIERQIEAGRHKNYAHAARVLGVSRARMSQVQGLVLGAMMDQGCVLVEWCTNLSTGASAVLALKAGPQRVARL